MRGYFSQSATAALLGLVLLVVLLGVVVLSTSIETVPEPGGTYVEGVVGQPRYLNPILCQLNEADEDIAALVFSGLTRVGEGGVIHPDLAERWVISDEGRVYTFHLRPNAKWHDGKPFTADDVVFTVQAIQHPDYQGRAEIAELWRDVGVEAEGPYRVRFILKASYSPFLEYTTIGMLPAHLLRQVPASRLPADSFNARPIGTGPYRVVRASLSEIVLQANADYHGRHPYLNRLVFRFYPNAELALDALLKEAVQGLGRVPPESLDLLAQRQEYTFHSTPELSRLTLLLLNNRYPPLAQPEVRKAISHALDRRRLIEVGLAGQGHRAYSPIVPSSWAFKPDVMRYDFQPDRAMELLDAAGWRDTYGGVRQREGQRLKLVLLTNNNAQRVRVAEEISRQLAAVGIEVEVQGASWVDLVRNFLVPHNFQMVLAEQWFPNTDPDVYPFWHSSQIAEGLNFIGWSNRQADDLLERARQETDRTVREALYEEFQQVFAEEEPSVLLYYPLYTYCVNKEIKGVRVGTILVPSDRFRYLDEWYVKTRLVFRSPHWGSQRTSP